MDSNKITFFTRFEQDILAGRKTITIRDKSESSFQPNQILAVYTNETDWFFCQYQGVIGDPDSFRVVIRGTRATGKYDTPRASSGD